MPEKNISVTVKGREESPRHMYVAFFVFGAKLTILHLGATNGVA